MELTLVPTYNFTVSGRELKYLIRGLKKLPGRDAEDLCVALEVGRAKRAADYANQLRSDTSLSRGVDFIDRHGDEHE